MLVALNSNKERVLIRDTSANETYYCPLCNEELVLRKGNKKRHHFAHKPKTTCSESRFADMCEWHINWQNRFPKDNIEVLKIDEDGKKHIADVLINNIEIEFQHSYMPFEEFDDRNKFYNKFNYHIVWIFDGNDVYNKGFNGGPFPFSKKFECLKKITNIPNYLDIFIEGNVQNNLLTDSGLFLHHVGSINEKEGILFDGKCKIEDFMKRVNDNTLFNFNEKKETNENQTQDIQKYNENGPHTILNISRQYPDANYFVLYNIVNKYDVLIDRDSINRLKQGKKIYGKLKNHGKKNNFCYDKTEIYYSKDPVWIHQTHY